MGRFFPILAITVLTAMPLVATVYLAITVLTAMPLVATAYPDHDEHHDVHEVEHVPFVPVTHAGLDVHVQQLGKFVVERFDEQTHAELKFIQVVEAEVFYRGTEHYTYHLVMKVHDGYDFKLYKCGVLHDLPGFEEPPVLNLGHFEPL